VLILKGFLMKNKYVIILINILIYTLFNISVSAKTNINSIFLEKFTTFDGLSDNHINDFLKDKFGISWIATDFGVTRYDGTHFQKISEISFSAEFKNKSVTSIFEFDDGLVFHFKDAGILFYDPRTNKSKIISRKSAIRAKVHGEHIYYFCADGYLHEYFRNKYSRYLIGNINNFELNLYKNNLYFFIRDQGLIKFNLTRKKIDFKIKNDTIFNNVSSRNVALNNIIINKHHFYKVHENGVISRVVSQQSASNVTYYGMDLDKNPLYIVKTKTIFSKAIDFNLLIEKYHLTDRELRKVLQIDPKTYFILTNQGLIKVSLQKKISSIISKSLIYNPNDIQVRRKIIPISSQELIFLGYPGIIHLQNNQQQLIQYNNKPLPCYDGVRFGENIYITSEGAGVFVYNIKSKKLSKIISTNFTETINFNAVESIDNQLCFVSTGKMILYNPITRRESRFPLPANETPYCIKYDEKTHKIYVGTSKSLLIYNLNHQKISFVKRHLIGGAEIRDLLISKDFKSIYLATNKGFYRLNSQNYKVQFHYVDFENMSNNLVCSINEAANQQLWFTTFSGILNYDSYSNKVICLSQKNGLHNIEYNYKAATLYENELFVGGLNNYEVFHIHQFEDKDKKNQLFLSSYTLISFSSKKQVFFDRVNPPNLIEFKSENQELNLNFSSISYAQSSSFIYKYQLNNGSWKTMENGTLRLANIPYGEYNLSVKLIDHLGKQIDIKKFKISAFLSFYKKPNFLILLLVIFLIFSFFIIYLIQKRTRDIKATKKRIAMDLHDEAGTILTRTLLFIRMNNHTTKTPFSNKIEANIQELLFSIRVFMTSLSTNKSTTYNLGDELQEFFFKNSQESERTFLFTNLIQQEIVISNELYRDIKLCIFEITNNFLKHSNGEKLSVFLQLKDKKIILLFEDSGNNFDPSKSDAGNGLRNIKKRTERNKGIFKIDKKKENSIISIIFPL
jgi:anti-sigma regulatory factor (Ser/Thr protein kinase)